MYITECGPNNTLNITYSVIRVTGVEYDILYNYVVNLPRCRLSQVCQKRVFDYQSTGLWRKKIEVDK